MNNPKNKVSLGVNVERPFITCNMTIHGAFSAEGDGAYNDALLLPELVEEGVRLLVYSGNADTMYPPAVRLLFLPVPSTHSYLLYCRVMSSGWRNFRPSFYTNFQKLRADLGSHSALALWRGKSAVLVAMGSPLATLLS
jgi:hypothetical protein